MTSSMKRDSSFRTTSSSYRVGEHQRQSQQSAAHEPQSSFLNSLYRSRRRSRFASDNLLRDTASPDRNLDHDSSAAANMASATLSPTVPTTFLRSSASLTPSSTQAEPGSPSPPPSPKSRTGLPKLLLSDLSVSPNHSRKNGPDTKDTPKEEHLPKFDPNRELDQPLPREPDQRDQRHVFSEVPLRDENGNVVQAVAAITAADVEVERQHLQSADRKQAKALVLALRGSNQNLKECQDELRKCLLSFEEQELHADALKQDLEVHRCRIERENAEKCRKLQIDCDRLRKRVDALTMAPSDAAVLQESAPVANSSASATNDKANPGRVSLALLKSTLLKVFQTVAFESAAHLANVHVLISACTKDSEIRWAIQHGSYRSLLGDLLNQSDDNDIISRRSIEHNILLLPYQEQVTTSNSDGLNEPIFSLRSKVNEARNALSSLRMDVLYQQKQVSQLFSDGMFKISNRSCAESTLMVQLRHQLSEEQRLKEAVEAVYRKESNWRRLLHNQLLEMKGNIRVVCRLRPDSSTETQAGEGRRVVLLTDQQSPNLLTLVNPRNGMQSIHEYDFVFPPETTQEQAFAPARDLVTSVLDGFSVCIFAYGQTGSGKSYTLEGGSESTGITQRSLKTLFDLMGERAVSHEYNVTLSIIELYDRRMFDLLADPTAREHCQLKLVRDAKGTVEVKGAMEIDVSNWRSMQQGLRRGLRERRSDHVRSNDRGSRSHCIVRVGISGLHLATGRRYSSRLHLVDLAGSEHMNTAGSSRLSTPEATQHIRKSLSALGNCLYALNTKRANIPYQDDKLTYLLSDSFSGDSKTLMYVCLNTTSEHLSQTLNSLKFAGRVRQIRQAPKPHIDEATAAALTRSLPVSVSAANS